MFTKNSLKFHNTPKGQEFGELTNLQTAAVTQHQLMYIYIYVYYV
jgi:hypothetical protein